MPEEPKEEDDWTAYATAGFGQTDYSLWDDVNVEETESTDEEADFDEGDDLDDEMWEEPEQLGTHTEEVPAHPTLPATSTWSGSAAATPALGVWAASSATIRAWVILASKFERPSLVGTRTLRVQRSVSASAPSARTSSTKWTCWRI